jgi:hypothetical protein
MIICLLRSNCSDCVSFFSHNTFRTSTHTIKILLSLCVSHKIVETYRNQHALKYTHSLSSLLSSVSFSPLKYSQCRFHTCRLPTHAKENNIYYCSGQRTNTHTHFLQHMHTPTHTYTHVHIHTRAYTHTHMRTLRAPCSSQAATAFFISARPLSD